MKNGATPEMAAGSVMWAASPRFRFTRARPNDASGHRQLPDVTHRVFCAMHKTTDDGRRELSPSHAAKVVQCGHIDGAQLRNGCVNPAGEPLEDSRDVRGEKLLTFRLNRRELVRRQRVAAGVGEKAIDDPGDVAHVKGRGRHSRGARVPFALGQRLDDLADALAHLQQDVRDWLEDGRDAVDRPALPQLGVGHLSGSPAEWWSSSYRSVFVVRAAEISVRQKKKGG